MTLKEKLKKLATERSNPCITISINTHRTHPDNLQDEIKLKNLVKEAKDRVLAEFTERDLPEIIQKLDSVEGKVDIKHLQDSLHIFISKDTEEIIMTMWPTEENAVYVNDHFAIKPIIYACNRNADYLILKLSQDATHLYQANNDRIVEEIKNHVFPFGEKAHFETETIQRSDSEFMDSMVREHFRDIDKALVDYITTNDMNMKVVVVALQDNFSKLQQVATRPEIYMGQITLSHLDKEPHQLAEQVWKVVAEKQSKERKDDLSKMKDAISAGQVVTDLQEIYRASLDGRADMLIVHEDFKQPVKMTDERSFEYGSDPSAQGFIDDITSNIAWKVMSGGGKVVFTSNDEVKELGDIALKTRY